MHLVLSLTDARTSPRAENLFLLVLTHHGTNAYGYTCCALETPTCIHSIHFRHVMQTGIQGVQVAQDVMLNILVTYGFCKAESPSKIIQEN
jgi:hypothetical protein